MPRKKRASVVDTLLSVKGVARLLRNITVQDLLGSGNIVASRSNSLAEQSSSDRRSRRTSESSGSKRRHQRAGTRPKSEHPGAWPESSEPRDPEETFQDDESGYWDYEDDKSLESSPSDRHGHTSRAVFESDSRYALFQDSRNDFSKPSTSSQSTRRTQTTVQLPTQQGARSVASSSRGAAKSKSLCIDGGYRRKPMREDTDLESSGSERSATRQMKSHSRPKDDDRFDHKSSPAYAAETANTQNEHQRDYSSASDDDQYQTKRGHDGRPYHRQFTKQMPRRQVRFVKPKAQLRELVDIKLSPSQCGKFEAHYQKMLAQKQGQGSDSPKQPQSPAPNPSSDAPPMSSQSAAPELLTAPSLPASPVSTNSRALSTASVPRYRTASEVSVPTASPSAFRTTTSSTAATVSSAWDSTAFSVTASRAPSYTSTRAPSHTASRAPSRADSRIPSCTTSRASKTQQNGCDSFIATSAASSVKPTPSSWKSTSNPVDHVISPRPESTKAASMYKNPVNEEHPHEQPGEKVNEHGDKQHDVQVNEGPGERVDEPVDKHVDEHVDEQANEQANEQGKKQPEHQAKDSVSTSKETTHGGHATIPDVAINGNSKIGSNQCHLQGLLPEVYDCKYKTRHCYACSRPRDMRYVDFRHRLCPGEEPQRSLCRTCRRCLDRNKEFSLVPNSTNKRTLKDIKKFQWCAQCGTIRSQKFHEFYPSGEEVPPRHQLCHPCCRLAKSTPKTGSSTYNPSKVNDGASNNIKQRAGCDEKRKAGNSLHQRKDISSADDFHQDGPTVAKPLPVDIPAEETHSPKPPTPAVSPDPGHQHHPSKSHAMTETSASQTAAESSSQAQIERPVADPAPGKHDSPGGLGGFNSTSWQIPADDSPPPQRKRSTANSGFDQGNEGQFYENIHVNYHEIVNQGGIWDGQTKHHRNRYDASLPEILLTAPTEEAHITQPTVVLDEQCPGIPLPDNLPQFSWKDGPARDHSKYQRQPSMQSQASNQTVRPSDNNFSSCRNKVNYPDYPPQDTTPRQFHWPTERGEVDDNQPKGLSDMFYETDEGKRADAFFASMSSWSEPKAKPKSRAESTENYNTWPPSSYDTTEPAAYEYREKRRSKRPSVIPGSPPHGHVRKVSDSLSVETVGLWQGVTPGAPTAEITEPESPAGEEVSHVACRVRPSRKKGAKQDSGSAASIF